MREPVRQQRREENNRAVQQDDAPVGQRPFAEIPVDEVVYLAR